MGDPVGDLLAHLYSGFCPVDDCAPWLDGSCLTVSRPGVGVSSFRRGHEAADLVADSAAPADAIYDRHGLSWRIGS